VADDPRNIMAALLHDHLIPKALFQNSLQNQHPLTTSTFSHNLAATTPKSLLNNPAIKTNNHNLLPHQKPTPANIKGAKRSPDDPR
jgi:hypothetical protein